MFPSTSANVRNVLVGNGRREVRHDFVEVQMLEQFEAGRTQNMCVLQNLHGIPIAGLHQHWQRRSREGDENGFLSRQ